MNDREVPPDRPRKQLIARRLTPADVPHEAVDQWRQANKAAMAAAYNAFIAEDGMFSDGEIRELLVNKL